MTTFENKKGLLNDEYIQVPTKNKFDMHNCLYNFIFMFYKLAACTMLQLQTEFA